MLGFCSCDRVGDTDVARCGNLSICFLERNVLDGNVCDVFWIFKYDSYLRYDRGEGEFYACSILLIIPEVLVVGQPEV